MDNYIYYRVLDRIIKEKTILRSDLLDLTNLHRRNINPIEHLVKLGFLNIITVDKRATYYQITKKGLDLHKKMSIFYNRHDKLFKQLHIRLKLGVKAENDDQEKVVLLPTTQS